MQEAAFLSPVLPPSTPEFLIAHKLRRLSLRTPEYGALGSHPESKLVCAKLKSCMEVWLLCAILVQAVNIQGCDSEIAFSHYMNQSLSLIFMLWLTHTWHIETGIRGFLHPSRTLIDKCNACNAEGATCRWMRLKWCSRSEAWGPEWTWLWDDIRCPTYFTRSITHLFPK